MKQSKRVAMIALSCAVSLSGACAAPPEPDPTPAGADPGDKEAVAQVTIDGKTDWSLDPCQAKGWYGDGDCDWFCPRRDKDCDVPVLGPEPVGKPTRYPIVLLHGFNASPGNYWGFYRVPEALRADGHKVYVTTVPPYDTPAVRARSLARQIDAIVGRGGRVNLIAHSMGGLDARVLISGLGYGDRVVTLTTISTPHRGTAVADVGLKLLPGAADKALNVLATLWGLTYSDLSGDSHLREALAALAEQSAPAFNAAYRDDPRVVYQSYAGVSSVLGIQNGKDAVACGGQVLRHPGTTDRMSGLLAGGAGFVAHGAELRPNDGMVTVDSARWGRFLGCVPADHLDEVGQVRKTGPDPDTGFDAPRLYRNLAFELAARGF